MDWKALLKGAGGIAATIAAPMTGGLSTSIWNVAKKLTGIEGDDEQSRNEAAKIIALDPNLQLKFELGVRNIELEETKAILSDKQNARGREVAITKVTGGRDWNLYILAWTVLIGFFLLTWYLMKNALPTGSTQAVFMLFGALSGGFGTVLQYFFGAAKENSRKLEK